MKSLFGVVTVALLLSCASGPDVRAELIDDAKLNRDAVAWYPEDDAVVLKKEEVYRLERVRGREERTRVTLKQITAVRTERGRDQVADLRLRLPAKTKLVDVRARVVQDDGTSREVAGSEVLLQEPPKEEEDGLLLFALRFPDVRVGSILEYAVVYEYPDVFYYIGDSANEAYPVVDYSVDVECDPKWACHLATFNADTGPALDQVGSYWRLRWSALRLPPKPDEAFSPHWRSDNSWWANRIKAWNDLPDDYSGSVDWGVAMRWHAEGAFIEKNWAEGYETPRPNPWAGCSDDKCKFDKTVSWVRQSIELTGEKSYMQSRKLSEILKSKTGTDGERAILLARLLADAGLESWLAGLVFADQGVLLKDFPVSMQLSQALVYVPAQGNLKGQYVDTLCDFCGENEVRPSAVGVDAIQFRAIRKPARPKVETKLVTIDAKPGATATTEKVMRVAIQSTGAMRALVEHKWKANAAIPVALWKQRASPKELEQEPIDRAKQASAVIPATEYSPASCDLHVGECSEHYELKWKSGAMTDAEQVVVTLPMFAEQYRHVWTAKRRIRDIVRFQPTVDSETVVIAIPPGYEFTELPESFKKSSPLFDSEITVARAEDNVRITRKLTTRPGRRSKDEIAAVQQVLKHYDSASRMVLVFTRKAPLPTLSEK